MKVALSRFRHVALLPVLLLVVLFGVSLSSSYAAGNVKPLPADQVFQLEVTTDGPVKLNTNWKIKDGYFLYKNRIDAKSSDLFTLKKNAPPAQGKMNFEGEMEEVYAKDTVIPFVFEGVEPVQEIPVTVSYQGCAKQGFCYPPMEQTFLVNMVSGSVTPLSTTHAVSITSIRHMLTDHEQVQTFLENQTLGMLWLVFFGIGVLLAFTPCVLPMLPILTGIIVGQKGKVSTRKAFLLSFTYVMGMAVTYAFAGVGAAMLGQSIRVWLQQPFFIIFVSLLFVLLGLSLFEFYDLPFSKRLQNKVAKWSAKHKEGTFYGVFFMGVLSTLVVSPCVTAPLVGVLLYVGQTGSVFTGATSLFAIGLGMGIPLMLVGTSMGRLLPKSGHWMHVVVKLFGMVMFAMALWILSRVLPESVTVALWGLYFIGIAIFFALYMPDLIKRKLLNRALGGAMGLLGVLIMLNAAGMFNAFNSVTGLGGAVNASFKTVSNMTDLKSQLNQAESKGLPVLVDFYADWCESCIVMEKQVFAASRVRPILEPFVLLRVDLSANSSEDQKILRKFKVIAPPTILFFNAYGKEVKNKRIVGELSTEDFVTRMDQFMAKDCDKKVQC